MKKIGLKNGDTILAINGTAYNLDNIYEMIMSSIDWKENDPISFKVKRNGKETVLKNVVKLPFEEINGFKANESKTQLREAWLKK